MSIEDYPLRAKDGMIMTAVETYTKLYQLTLITRDPEIVRMVMDGADIPGDDRMALIGAFAERKRMLQQTLRAQVSALATLDRQSK